MAGGEQLEKSQRIDALVGARTVHEGRPGLLGRGCRGRRTTRPQHSSQAHQAELWEAVEEVSSRTPNGWRAQAGGDVPQPELARQRLTKTVLKVMRDRAQVRHKAQEGPPRVQLLHGQGRGDVREPVVTTLREPPWRSPATDVTEFVQPRGKAHSRRCSTSAANRVVRGRISPPRTRSSRRRCSPGVGGDARGATPLLHLDMGQAVPAPGHGASPGPMGCARACREGNCLDNAWRGSSATPRTSSTGVGGDVRGSGANLEAYLTHLKPVRGRRR